MPTVLRQIALPSFEILGDRPEIPASIYEARVTAAYDKAGVDWLAIYSDREHFGNIVFLSGFEPRFEEAFLLLGPQNKRVLITGNECESYASIARLPCISVLRSQSLSLMAQDRTQDPRFIDRLRDADIKSGDTVGLVDGNIWNRKKTPIIRRHFLCRRPMSGCLNDCLATKARSKMLRAY